MENLKESGGILFAELQFSSWNTFYPSDFMISPLFKGLKFLENFKK